MSGIRVNLTLFFVVFYHFFSYFIIVCLSMITFIYDFVETLPQKLSNPYCRPKTALAA
ncbi:hypothetical protein GTCCBUS3UF5_13160 [Geobacillus thermoleovorans CCB_US3_UF5]|uniref:Uncharacterized protein n=1 Tax=Geobacillus thermoleovorans CCB_US3_UF5 TaxID=1111068 RepID=A0ABM5MGB0_GEOTH|nr:hypothetical protein GTCCBUS3UF5_13160 [Geobacillus thermoleovorans CCB_US3_UF5]GAJ59546.1 hypothetical protein B23_2771 [Geobacillus thermoleovorans B23]